MNQCKCLFVCLALALSVAFAIPFTATPAAAHNGQRHDLLLTGGRWWDGERFVVRDRVYTVAGTLSATPAGAVVDTLDLSGRWILPAFADAHTHVLSDTAGFARRLRGLIEAGILFAENPNTPGSRIAPIRQRLATPGTLEMHFATGGLTSPGGHPVRIYEPNGASGARTRAGDAYFEIADRAALERAWPQVLASKPDLVKVYLESAEFHAARAQDPAWFGKRGLDPSLLPDVVKRARAAGLGIAAHVTSAFDFRTAVAAGVTEIAHLPLERITRADAEAAARAGVTVVTTVVSHRPLPAGVDLDAIHRDNLRVLRDAGVRLVLGTDHPARNVVDEVLELARIGAGTAPELIAMLTSATPRYLAPARRLALRPDGDEATFVVLEADPLADLANLRKVAWSMKRGYRVELPVLPPTRPSIADSLAPFLMRGDLAGALEFEDRARRERPDAFDFGEQQLNALGYRMLQHGAVEGAVAIFRRNAERFPSSPNVFDSMADAQIAARDSAGAAASYRRALALLPEAHRYAAEMRDALERRAREFLARFREE